MTKTRGQEARIAYINPNTVECMRVLSYNGCFYWFNLHHGNNGNNYFLTLDFYPNHLVKKHNIVPKDKTSDFERAVIEALKDDKNSIELKLDIRQIH